MRKIKFRAWDYKWKNMFLVGVMESSEDDFIINEAVGQFYKDGEWDTFILKSFELMQFTGLKTRDGVEIFEGDIIECRDGKYIIEYVENFAKFVMTRGNSIQDADTCMRSIKVIGNIYENPELRDVLVATGEGGGE